MVILECQRKELCANCMKMDTDLLEKIVYCFLEDVLEIQQTDLSGQDSFMINTWITENVGGFTK